VWWTQWPAANIAIATGDLSGIFVLDVDGEHGEQSLRNLEQRLGQLPPTVEVITGSGGRHIYFRLPEFPGAPIIRNSASKIGVGLDIRGNKGYVIAPPSLHESGRRYQWSVDSADRIVEAPGWLIGLIAPSSGIAQLDGRRSAEHWVRIAAEGVDEGARNTTLASLTGHLLRHNVDVEVVAELVLAWNSTRCRPPLSERECLRTIESIAKSDIARRSGR
jgi:hypothetical protein